MRYMSNDGRKVFETEHECRLYEGAMKVLCRNMEEKVKSEERERERKLYLKILEKKYNELQKLVLDYQKEYGMGREVCFTSSCDFIRMLCE